MVGCGCWLWLRGDWVLGVGGVVLGAWLVWVLVVVWCLFFERNARSVSQHTNLAEVWPSASLHNTVVLPTDLEPHALTYRNLSLNWTANAQGKPTLFAQG